jgi:hypothetical protein
MAAAALSLAMRGSRAGSFSSNPMNPGPWLGSPLLGGDFDRSVFPGVEAARDFIILHYKVTEREEAQFRRYCKNMSVPESLACKVQMFLH